MSTSIGNINSIVRLEEIQLAASDETTDLAVGTDAVTFRMPYGMTLEDLRDSVTTASAGADIQVTVNQGGSAVASVITIEAGATTSTSATTQPTISNANLIDDAQITVDITQIGSTTAGAGLKVTLIGKRA